MTTRYLDPRSVAGKDLHIDETCQVLVVGAGTAGLAAALEARSLGLNVLLVDENPVPFATMGEDVPLHYGGGMSPLARNQNAMMEAFIASDPTIEAAFEADVDIRLGTAVWGLYDNGDSVGWLAGPLAGLSDGTRSWLVGCDRIIVASGRRDMGLAFPGWEKPGVLGATAAYQLATRYGALAATNAVILGTSSEALAVGIALQALGIRVAAIVEQADAPVGPAAMLATLTAGGAELLTGHVVREAVGRDQVEAVLVSTVENSAGAPEQRINCDAVILAVGTTPVVDLMDSLGCRIRFQADRGGYAPVLVEGQRSTVPSLYVAGDCAGIWPAKSLDRSVAEREGRAAARQVAAALGRAIDGSVSDQSVESVSPVPEQSDYDVAAYRLAWVRASVIEARGEPYVCQCEEVTAREILEVRPPRSLAATPDRRNDRSLHSLLGEGPPNPDQVKRLTRAGMGPCQGRRCREQVACLLALGSSEPLASVPLAGYRAPVRPLALRLAGDMQEPAAMTAEWDTWFGIAPQYRLAAELPRLYTVAAGNPAGPVASE